MSIEENTVNIIRQDLDGSVIKQTPASIGYQVWFRGKFLTFTTSIVNAHRFLSTMQDRANGVIH